MRFTIKYHPRVVAEDIPKLSSDSKRRISRSILQKLATAPIVFGKPLRHSLVGNYAMRVGDYRVVYLIERNAVKVIAIQHRSKDYKGVKQRLTP